MKKKTSEFGKGFIYNLILFAKHYDYAQDRLDKYKELHKKHPKLFSEERALSMWINGASDHLFELEIPKRFQKIKEIKELQDLALSYGHGALMMTGMPKDVYTKIGNLLSIIALAIDKKLGVKTIKASFE